MILGPSEPPWPGGEGCSHRRVWWSHCRWIAAARSACPLVTFDTAVLKAFPEIARRPRDLVGSW